MSEHGVIIILIESKISYWLKQKRSVKQIPHFLDRVFDISSIIIQAFTSTFKLNEWIQFFAIFKRLVHIEHEVCDVTKYFAFNINSLSSKVAVLHLIPIYPLDEVLSCQVVLQRL